METQYKVTMPSYSEIKQEVLSVNKDTRSILRHLDDIAERKTVDATRWEETLSLVDTQISEEIIRVAIVGAIKSGKSTVANRLIGGDFLRRGAGVVTSVVTRIHSGSALKAKIHLKSWEEINQDIDQAMIVFPTLGVKPENDTFDIRNDNDRAALVDAMANLDHELHITSDARNEHSVFLTSYLKGYEDIVRITRGNGNYIEYNAENFHEHGQFAGNEILAAFVKDMELEINTGELDNTIELADCQGSDSPNPFHLAQVQDYLLQTNLIVYVISSRTGLRREDIRFLSMIREMGVIENILFVINVDFNEHHSIPDLKRVMDKVHEDVSLIRKSPDIYTFSGLFSLYRILPELVDAKDRQKFDIWQGETEFVALNNTEFDRFFTAFHTSLSQKRYTLLLKNNLEKIDMVLKSLKHWAALNREILTSDSLNVKLIHDHLSKHQKKMGQIQKLINSTFEGGLNKLKKELKGEANQFFDDKYGQIVPGVVEFIHNYSIEYQNYTDHFKDVGFANTLYMIFREFKQALDTYMTETVNPKIMRFSKTADGMLEETLHAMAQPFDGLIRDMVKDYQTAMDEAGLFMDTELNTTLQLPGVDVVKKKADIGLPAAGTITQYSSFIKTDAFVRYGVFAISDYIRNLFRRGPKTGEKEGGRALLSGIDRIKKETEKSIKFYFLNYRENLKFKYLFAVATSLSEELKQSLNNRFNHFFGDLDTISRQIAQKSETRENASQVFIDLENKLTGVRERIQTIRQEIERV